MRRLTVVFLVSFTIVLLMHNTLLAQSLPDQIAQIAQETNAKRISLNQGGMLVLGGWAAANIASGAAGYLLAEDDRWRYFHQMNAGWNVINLAIATFGYLGQGAQDPASFTWLETLQEAESMQKILLFNAGLDVGYMAFGGYLWEKGRHDGSDRLVGYGRSIILQGAFLMSFDLALYFLNSRLAEDFSLQLAPAAQGVGTALRLTF